MNWSEIINLILGGGFLACLVGILSLRSTLRKANAEAEKARAEAETVEITNTENATRILVENIVKPLKEELNATREDLQATKREMVSTKRELARFRKALDTANGCRYADDCPVLRKLRDDQKGREHRSEEGVGAGRGEGQCTHRGADSQDGGYTGKRGESERARGQPP